MLFRDKALRDPEAYFHRFKDWSDEKALTFAADIWATINAKNLMENILPFKQRARLILQKGQDHAVERVLLRKL
jgi:type I pantothenate kinase